METRPLAHLNMQIYNIYLKNETKMCEIVTKKLGNITICSFFGLCYHVEVLWKYFPQNKIK